MKIALVHDYLCGMGGAERVFQYICEEFAEADIFTLAYNQMTTLPYFASRKINTTYLNRFVRSMDAFRWSFPLATYAMEGLDLREYDLAISSSATVAKYIRVPNGKHLCYCYMPTRALWHFEEYFGNGNRAILVRPVLGKLQARDYSAAQRIDRIVAISEASKAYIKQYYDKDSEVVYSPIDLKMFQPSKVKNNNFLIVSRLEHWKRIDYAIEAFNALGLPLRVIGTGREEARLRALAKKNVCFLGSVDDHTLATEYANARAVIFTPFLEYGLIPLEASASGTPVICYGRGGVTETMIGLDSSSAPGSATAVFFYEQSAQSLIAAIREFEKARFSVDVLVTHARKWDVPEFKKKMRCLSVASSANNEIRSSVEQLVN